MNVFKHLNDLGHNYDFLHNFFDNLRHFDNPFLGNQNRVKIFFDNSVNDLKSIFNKVNIVSYLF